jgi:hypothetical protein
MLPSIPGFLFRILPLAALLCSAIAPLAVSASDVRAARGEAASFEFLPGREPNVPWIPPNEQPLKAAQIRAELLFPAKSDLGVAGDETLPPDSLLNRKPHDPWLAFDKVQHVTFSFLFTLGGQYTLVNKAAVSERGALPVSAAGAMMIGLGKELYDWQWGRTRTFSTRDLAANAVGVVLAVGYVLL